MRRRQPIQLWLYVLSELWRLILLTLGVLVLVLAFAVAIKPLADGKIGPVEALRFMGLAVIPMLQYALPFAAGFGATLAYHRLSADNEVIAAHASGVSHRSILAPALMSGIVLAGALVVLNQQVIPAFLRSMEQMITQDVAKMLISSIQRGQSVSLGDMRVYADSVVRVEPLAGGGATDEFILSRVAVLRVDHKGNVKQDFTAAKAHVWVMAPGTTALTDDPAATDDSSSAVIFQVEDAVVSEPGKLLASGEEFTRIVDAGKAFKDDPKFLTFGQLQQLRNEPDRMNWIANVSADLAARLITKVVTEEMQARLAVERRLTLRDAQGRRMIVQAGSMVWNDEKDRWDLVPVRTAGPIDIEIRRDGEGQGVTRLAAREVSLQPSFRAGPADQRLVFKLSARQAIVRGLDAATGARDATAATVAEREYTDVTYPPGEHGRLADRSQVPMTELIRLVRERVAQTGPDGFLTGKCDELEHRVAKLHREVISKQHERFAMAAACLVMVITGAITAVQLSQSLPLTVYLWSFFPALAALITISSGQQVTHDKGLWGLVILWGGVGLLGVYGAMGYARLARH